MIKIIFNLLIIPGIIFTVLFFNNPSKIYSQGLSETWEWQGYSIGRNATGPAYCNEANMPEIQKIGGQYILYYGALTTAGKAAVYYATSPDLSAWTVRDTILTGSTDTASREYILGGARIIKINTGQYRMFYRCAQRFTGGSEPKYHIRSAISNDGFNFTKEGIRIEIKAYQSDSYFTHVGHSAFYRDANGIVRAFLTAKDTSMTPAGPDRLYTAYSPDEGLTWTGFMPLYSNAHDPVVIRDSTGLYHVYFANLAQGFRKATSGNGILWSSAPDSILFKKGSDYLTPSSSPYQIGDLGAVVSDAGNIILYSAYKPSSPGPWENIVHYSRLETGIISNANEIPPQFKLHQNYPNPFNSSTIITYELSARSKIVLKIFEVTGKEVRTLIEGSQEAGYYSILFNALYLSSGVYLYNLYSNGNLIISRKMVYLE